MHFNNYQLSAFMRDSLKENTTGEHNKEVLINYAPSLFIDIDMPENNIRDLMSLLLQEVLSLQARQALGPLYKHIMKPSINPSLTAKERLSKATDAATFLLDYIGQAAGEYDDINNDPLRTALKKFLKDPEAAKYKIPTARKIDLDEYFNIKCKETGEKIFRQKQRIIREFITALQI